MAEIKRTNDVAQLLTLQGYTPRAILLKTDAKDKLIRAQMAANPYNPDLDSESTSPVIPASTSVIEEQPIVANASFSSPIDPATLLNKEEPVIPAVAEIPVTATTMEAPKVEMPEVSIPIVEEASVNPVEALQRVQEALSVSMKIVDECLNELAERDQYKKVA